MLKALSHSPPVLLGLKLYKKIQHLKASIILLVVPKHDNMLKIQEEFYAGCVSQSPDLLSHICSC